MIAWRSPAVFKAQPWDPELPSYLTPVARAPGSTGPQVTMAGRLGPARRDTVFIIASAAAHQPPDGAQATGGGTLWATDAVRNLQTLPAPPQMALRHLYLQDRLLHPCPNETVKENVTSS